jgi:hypothetical protein
MVSAVRTSSRPITAEQLGKNADAVLVKVRAIFERTVELCELFCQAVEIPKGCREGYRPVYWKTENACTNPDELGQYIISLPLDAVGRKQIMEHIKTQRDALPWDEVNREMDGLKQDLSSYIIDHMGCYQQESDKMRKRIDEMQSILDKAKKNITNLNRYHSPSQWCLIL